MKLFLNLLLAFLIILIALPVVLVFNTIDWMRQRGDWLIWRINSSSLHKANKEKIPFDSIHRSGKAAGRP